jgi:hypothetical protein
MRRTEFLIATVASVLFVAPVVVCAQTATEDLWQPIIWNLEACVRSNAPLARASGIHTTADAVSFFFRLCENSLQEDVKKKNLNGVAVAPGRFRIAIEKQWLRSKDSYKTPDPTSY